MLFMVKNLKVRYSGDDMEEYVILVDQDDNPIGKEEKVKCHLPNGKLHRAFTALIFNGEGKLLLTKRSESKMPSTKRKASQGIYRFDIQW